MELEGNEYVDVLKSINIKYVTYIITKSHEDVLILKLWRKTWLGVQEAVENM